MTFNSYVGVIHKSDWKSLKTPEDPKNLKLPTKTNKEKIDESIQHLAQENAQLKEQLVEYKRQAEANAHAQSFYTATFIRYNDLERKLAECEKQARIDNDINTLLSASLEMHERSLLESKETEQTNSELIYLLGEYQKHILHLQAYIENLEADKTLVSSMNTELHKKTSLLKQACSEYFAILVKANLLNEEFLKNFNTDLSRTDVDKHLYTTKRVVEFLQEKEKKIIQLQTKMKPSFIHPLVLMQQNKQSVVQTNAPGPQPKSIMQVLLDDSQKKKSNFWASQKRIQELQEQFPKKQGETETVEYDKLGLPRVYQ